MSAKTVLHDQTIADTRLTDLALFSLTTDEQIGRLNERRIVRGLEIFRAGSFKDSRGQQRTWSVDELRQLADNFTTLRVSGTFPNVPVRTDHTTSVASLVGYIENVAVVGDRLVADVEFTEPEHFARFDRGTYRSRSVEIGRYEDNDGNEYWPVVMGLAFVDIPAIEGLHRAPATAEHFRYQDGAADPKETTVPEKTPEGKPTEAPPAFTFRLRGEETTDFGKVQAHVAALEGENDALKTRNVALETFAAEQKTAGRHNFVSSLAEAKKIAATQIDALKAVVESMSDDQFEAFQKAYDAAPAMSLLGNHGEGVTNPEGQPSEVDQERQTLEETIAMHRRAGMTDEDVAKTSSYRKLAQLNGQK